MKILSWLITITFSFNFYIITAQVDSTINASNIIRDFPSYRIINDRGNSPLTVQEHLFRTNGSSELSIGLFQQLYFPEYIFNYDKQLTDKNKNYSIDFSRVIPKGNPVFSIRYALFYGLYSENKYLLKRWDCID